MEGVTLRGTAEVQAARGHLDDATRSYEDALRVFTANGVEGEVPLTMIGLASTCIDRGDRERARMLLATAIENQQPLAAARGRSELGRLHLLEGRFAEAEVEYAKTVELTRRLGYVSLLPAALAGLAAAHRGRGDLARAQALYRESADAIETIRARIPALEQRAAFAAMSHRTYEGLVEVAIAMHDFESAFAALERERSQNTRANAGRASARPLDAQITRIQLQLASETTPREQRLKLLDDLDDAERRLTAMQGRAHATANAIPPLSALRRVLQRDERFVAITETFAFVVDSERLRVVKLPPLDQLGARAEFFTELLASNDAEGSVTAGRRLVRELVAPWIDALAPNTRRLILSTSGAIARVPFAALPDPRDPARPLLARFDIVHVPSLTALAASRRDHATRRRTGRVLAIRSGSNSRRVAIGADSWELPPLRSSAAELGGVTHETKPMQSTRFRDFDLIHFNAHAFLDPRIASRSAIVVDVPRGDDDGLLQTREIAQLDLGGAAVVLASCQTAVGPASPAEGMYSLARAFSVAGASAVIATHWSVRDRASAQFFARFYRHLARGDAMAAALRVTQLETMGDTPYANAKDWAAFTIIGDGAIVPLRDAQVRSTRWVWIGGIVFVAVVLLAWQRARPHRVRTITPRGSGAT